MAEEYVGRKFKTVFVGSDRADEAVVEDIRRTGKVLDELGLTPENAGNISVRTAEGMFITVGGVNKGLLSADDVVEVVGFDFKVALVVGSKEPSSETPMHWLIYQCYPSVNAVIHAHDDLAVSKAEMLRLQCGVESTKESVGYGTREQAFEAVAALEKSQYAVIRGHGIVCMGETLSEALGLITRIHSILNGDING